MSDLASWILQWTFSVAGLVHLIGIGVLVAAASWLGQSKSVHRFFLTALGLWVVASVVGASSSSTLRVALASAIWALTVVTFYAVVLGVLVANGKRPRTIIATSVVLLLLQVPLSLFSGLYLTCYIGHNCP